MIRSDLKIMGDNEDGHGVSYGQGQVKQSQRPG